MRAVEAAFRRGCSRSDFRLVHYSIQDDHAHLIVEADGAAALGSGMKRLAQLFAFAVNRALGRGRTGKVLADRYHHEVLTCPRQVRNALAYVLLNARRHAAKRIARLRKQGKPVKPLAPARVIDAASSGRWFDGWRDEARVDRSPPPALAARCRAGDRAAADVVPARGLAEASPDRSERGPGGGPDDAESRAGGTRAARGADRRAEGQPRGSTTRPAIRPGSADRRRSPAPRAQTSSSARCCSGVRLAPR